MNPNIEFEELKKQLFELGFNEEKINQLLDLALEDAIDIVIADLSENADESVLTQLEELIQTPINTQQEAIDRISQIFVKAYGDMAETKKFEYINQYLRDVIEDAKSIKEQMEKYQAGDPTAVAAVQSNIGDPDAQAIQDFIDDK
ncbi:MAG: hypothetical protein UR34_C0001G0003 [candidate division WS6 bacterium GW2011_GWC1_33_20]|uniref:Uncharacterized protein n=2 Tax=Candidatus Dojkabacteria TaxID=74243 RepID=A0A0G0CWU6_9BACT|nr:MAG: hypothetical protein UR32_C0003G0047 [candidate division WS6 bacterium GW2011_GWE2_33_157]KKP44657.1 MAG: hypothetical protein UR34_C0001G0003 [candidate division WS6 bacterium GW2011_GWC1_33_20]KKP46003.1 MAG: hypothetical protein UR36_C0002G0045 [candidate division WS6 bacterium GW2011_GWF1_33_233]KKP55485.1 MAG: hypothetical protein UR47_C0001G0046 [candidate division WS6 bacterium GW2011_GWB1_33_6]KKP55566.1 MAG: hypothetical protein UR45_C0001G0048 [candidate division WS6 bacterium